MCSTHDERLHLCDKVLHDVLPVTEERQPSLLDLIFTSADEPQL